MSGRASECTNECESAALVERLRENLTTRQSSSATSVTPITYGWVAAAMPKQALLEMSYVARSQGVAKPM